MREWLRNFLRELTVRQRIRRLARRVAAAESRQKSAERLMHEAQDRFAEADAEIAAVVAQLRAVEHEQERQETQHQFAIDKLRTEVEVHKNTIKVMTSANDAARQELDRHRAVSIAGQTVAGMTRGER